MALVSGGFTQFLRTSGEDGGRVGFRDREGDEDINCSGEDELDPVQPSPASRVGQETTDEGTDSRTNKGSC